MAKDCPQNLRKADSHAPASLDVRLIAPSDNPAIADVIRRVSAEHGLSADAGFSVADPTLDYLSEQYTHPHAAYWVIEADRVILGGGGVAPLPGHDGVCELQKMYFLPALRGKGIAKRLAVKAMDTAREWGYQRCYLETTANLTAAIALYQSLGFVPCPRMGNTGHDSCEVTMIKVL
ncbi:GNAT family N-acetyltransferase [Salinivibrio sp. MA427]|uniref:GNAT family N-acetyltransferase n=2 Tax=Salinivibrio TaxID=51366 RepID=A0ABX3KT87_SALCS|nr:MULTISPECIES: GNAT family N-acetyltransferase [Salinivibrio]OOF06479.1 GNAT family N-acetyltransferase [Salinivibrio sp. MA427]NUY57014.1 GNAT family N-acetyltransferase [Salinivibrio sp. EAGSL]OOE95086.1 GNAT family N-acetyltransferase [Salinivibrio sp. AR640]OOF06946.1 GNAT family N-acetyltransferase [Salinivibrio sp. MA607]OOF34831.1 GNAT family N-acetyltransferase [Salinivibrio costicola subsp. alcaliphilus]